jgi:hypothetical protein
MVQGRGGAARTRRASDFDHGGFVEMLSRTRFHLGWILGGVLLAAPPASAQHDQSDERERARPEDDAKPITLGIQLTPQLLDSLLDKAARRLARDYDFDEYQHEQVRQLLHERVPEFLRQHQEQLQGLLNDWLEATAAEQPPDPEYAADWAERALPIVEAFKGMVGGLSEDMREFMTDEQQVLLDGYLAAFETGTRFATNRLQVFKEGGFDPEIHWPRSKQFKKIDRVEMQQLRREMEGSRLVAMEGPRGAPNQSVAEAAPPGEAKLVADETTAAPQPIAKTTKAEKDEWTRYVEAFIHRYQLDDEQKQKAYALLEQQLHRREHYELGKAPEIERIKSMYEKAGTDAKKLALAESAYQKLNKPRERMFEQLKQKLETLPTRAQRRAAALSEKKEAKQPTPAPANAAGKGRPQ